MDDQRTPRAIADEILKPLTVGNGVTEWRVCRLCHAAAYGGTDTVAHSGECPAFGIRSAIEAALVSAVDAQRQRDMATIRGVNTGDDTPELFARAIEQDGRKI